MTDKASDVAAIGGSRPAVTGPGAMGAGPTGGGKAVPDDDVLMGESGALGDTASMDDGGRNSGSSILEEAGAALSPQASPASSETQPNADAPIGSLSGTSVPSTGTIGGSPIGTAASRFGDTGL